MLMVSLKSRCCDKWAVNVGRNIIPRLGGWMCNETGSSGSPMFRRLAHQPGEGKGARTPALLYTADAC